MAQYGIPLQYHQIDDFSRYEHSIGTFLLLRLLGADLAEQIAGLLHDASHSAFSHVTDQVLGKDEKAQDERHTAFVLNTEIPEILLRNGLDPEHVLDLDSHHLLDRDVPDLCERPENR